MGTARQRDDSRGLCSGKKFQSREKYVAAGWRRTAVREVTIRSKKRGSKHFCIATPVFVTQELYGATFRTTGMVIDFPGLAHSVMRISPV